MALLVFIITLAILVLVHEWGHFIVARRAGARVDEFGFGFPPRLFSIRRGETLYSLNLIPLGGFVKIYGEEGEGRDDPRSFAAQPPRRKAAILLAGVTMNFLLAIVLLVLAHAIGIPSPIEEGVPIDQYRDVAIRIVQVVPGSPADQAGIRIGDAIRSLAIPDSPVMVSPAHINEVHDFIESHKGERITLTLERGKETKTVVAEAREHPPQGQGRIGIAMERIGIRQFPILTAVWEGTKSGFLLAYVIVYSFFDAIRDFVTGEPVTGDIAGPVGIYAMTRQFTQLGFVYILQFVALLSMTLAILNSVPYPALDGGQLLFVIIEKIKGAPLSDRAKRIANTVGFASLMLLILLITIRDIRRFF